MHVKEQVKEFVQDVKRKFSQKHKRDTCSTFDSYDYSSADTISHVDDSSSSSASSVVDTSERSPFIRFIRPRASSTTSKKHKNVLHRVRRMSGKRYRLFSAPSVPSERMVEPNHKQPASYQGPARVSPELDRDVVDERATLASLKDFPDVMDISARTSVQTGSESPEVESSQPSHMADRDSSQSQPPFDTESHSDASGTLVTTSGSERKLSVLESDSRFDSVDLYSDKNSEQVQDCAPASPTIAPMADLPPVPPPKSDPPHEEITFSPSPTTAPASPRVPHATPASPAPVYIPRLTAPSMFLPIPNTDPLSALLTKYVPAEQRPRRDVVGEYAGRDVHEMVMSNSWRALARMARDRIIASDPEDLGRILDLWSLRLSALARLRLTNQASAECTNLFAVLNAVPTASVPGAFPSSGSLPSSTALGSSSPAHAASPLSPLGGLAQLPATPSQKPSALPHSSSVVHPFELTVFHARVHYWSGDPLGYVDALTRILARCKERAREEGRVVARRRALAKEGGGSEDSTRSEQGTQDEGEGEGKNQEDETEEEDADEEDTEESTEGAADEDEEQEEDADKEDAAESTKDGVDQDKQEEMADDALVTAEANLSMWLERVARVCLILASQMVEMNDYQAAINLLAPLCTHRAPHTSLPTPSVEVHSALARVYLLSGDLQKAEEHFSSAASVAANTANGADVVAMNAALLAAASGDWTHAEEALSEIVAKDPGNFTAINNLAVALLSQGRIKEGIDLLEAALKTSPSSVVVAEPFLFNLSTLYELRSTAAIDKKRELLIEVAQWSGDGLKTSCLKMPSS